MRDEEYGKWLQEYVTGAAIVNYIKRCQRVEANLGIDLDDEFKMDGGSSLLYKLTYTTDDELHNRPLRCNIHFNAGSNLRNGMGSLKTAVGKYFEFCRNNRSVIKQEKSTLVQNIKSVKQFKIMDSYNEFMQHFAIPKEDFYKWGISATIFPDLHNVAVAWEELKARILGNQTVYIRGYGRDAHGTQLYKDLYEKLFGNSHIEKDPTNNAIPHRHIQQLTGLKRNVDVYNYQVSHIWGHTKNVFMFEAPWNICYTPKIIDPFTGHETQGMWPKEYQEIFISHAMMLFSPFIKDYNQLLVEYDVVEKTNHYLKTIQKSVPVKEFLQFEKDVKNELSAIIL